MASNEEYRGAGFAHYGIGTHAIKRGGADFGESPEKSEQPPHLEVIIAKLGGCFEAADEATKRANAVADRVVGGGQLPDPSVGSKMANIGGDIARVYDMLDGLSLRIRDAIAEISRLERL